MLTIMETSDVVSTSVISTMYSSSKSLEDQWKIHQQRYKELEKSFKRSCNSVTQIDDAYERDAVLQSAKQKMHEIEDLLQGMKSDLRSLQPKYPSSKTLFSREWHNYSKKYSHLKEEYQRSSSKNRFLSMETHSDYERERLLRHDEVYENMLLQSQKSLRLLAQSESIGMSVIDNLHSQGKKLEKVNIDLQDIKEISNRAQRTMKTLKTKVYTDRLLQGLIVTIELIIIVFLLWWKLRKDL